MQLSFLSLGEQYHQFIESDAFSSGRERLVKMIKNKILWCGDGKQIKMWSTGEKRGRK